MQQNFMGRNGFSWFVGVVEDRNDPKYLGRVRVRCLGLHTDDNIKLPTADLPWAHPMNPITSATVSGVGQGAERCNYDCLLPMSFETETAVSGTRTGTKKEKLDAQFEVPAVHDSDLPGLLGLNACRDNRMIIDTMTNDIFMVGPGVHQPNYHTFSWYVSLGLLAPPL